MRALAAALLMIATGSSCTWFDEETNVEPPAGEKRVALATMETLEGEVQLEREGAKRLATKETLYAKDAIQTGEDGAATVVFRDGQLVELGSNARFVLTEDDRGVVLQVERGIVLSRIPAGSKAASAGAGKVTLTILTPFGISRIGGGESAVKVDVTEDVATVEVQLGQIQLVARNGEVTEVKAGDAVEVRRDGEVSKVVQLETIAVTVYVDSGAAELRKKDEKRWRKVGKQGQTLAEGDSVRVRSGSGTLALDGSSTKVGLERGTELTYLKSGRDGGGEHAELSLQRGTLGLDLARERRTRIVVDALKLEADQGGQFAVLKTRDGYEVSAYAGDATVTRGEEAPLQMKAGERLRYAGASATPDVETFQPAELVLPARFGTRVFHSGLDEVALSWEGKEGDFFVRVARDAKFTELVREGRVHQPFVNVPAPSRGALYWKIFAADGETLVDSGSASFGREAKSRELARLRNEVPDGSEKTTIFFQDKPPAVTFTYASDPKAAQYKVAVFRMEELGAPVAEKVVAAVAAPLEAGALREGKYVWSVTPLDAKGQPLRGGRMNQLELVYDNSVPTLTVSTPRNGQRLTGRTVEAAGVAPVGTKLTINGKAAPLDEKNRFRVAVTPVGRPPMVIFRTMRSNEPDTFTVRTMKRGTR